jgi:hypothetical protein
MEIVVDGVAGQYDLSVDGHNVIDDAAFLESATQVERIVFRTGAFRLRDSERRPFEDGTYLTTRIPNADVPQAVSRFDIDNVTLEKQVPR